VVVVVVPEAPEGRSIISTMLVMVERGARSPLLELYFE
jgi:hypothetical protein